MTDAARILRIVDKESQHKEARRFSMLCIDASPNANLAQQLAERGGGVARFLSSSPKEEDITSALDEILLLWDVPVAVGLTLRVNRENLLVDRRKVTMSPDGMCHVDLGDLPAGKSTWVVVRAPPAKEPIRYELCWPGNCVTPVSVIPCPAVSAVFGARLISELEYLMHGSYPEKELFRNLAGLGYDPDSLRRKHPDKVYAENQMLDGMGLVKDLVIRASLNYKVFSAETAFVAVRSEAGRPVEEQVIIPNALPYGWSESFLPKGAGYRHYPIKKGLAAGHGISSSRGFSLDWVGGDSDVILQPDGTMKMECRRLPGNDSGADNFRGMTGVRITPGKQNAIPGSGSPAGYSLYSGSPVFTDGVAVLFDSTRTGQATKLPEIVVLKKLEWIIKDGTLRPATGLYLLLYLDDPAVPRIKVFLRDLLQHQNSRPLNIQRSHGEPVKIVLVDPDGEWVAKAPVVELVVR